MAEKSIVGKRKLYALYVLTAVLVALLCFGFISGDIFGSTFSTLVLVFFGANVGEHVANRFARRRHYEYEG